ncbi:tetratricopeptide repeat protein [uncultured Stenotrophomonas sp.]|uniref:tetratricopeptide repeat protein n=1 Tax=uncultured Stenotrophomonas sp. TaxID=165438 RepID=UPI0028E40FAC|nr:tetratricopeptide repeat protein [uncultured Stenotrophomonas sp.]
MTCRNGIALALMLSLCVAPLAATAAAASVDATAPLPEGDRAFYMEVGEAAQQAERGDTLGAAIVFERLLADPRLATLPVEGRSHVWASAAMVAAEQKDFTLATQRLQQALAINPRNAYARLRLAWFQLHGQQPVAAADSVIRGAADSEGSPDITTDMVWQLDTELKDLPEKRLALLQALFDRSWKNDGVEPVELWVTLATLQVEAGHGDRVAATLERVDAPIALVRLRSDKRFDPYLQRDDARHEPVAAARRQIDRLRVETMLRPGLNETAVELATALMIAGELGDVVGMTDQLAAAANAATEAPDEEGFSIGWMLDTRSRALRRLGENDRAVANQLIAVRMAGATDMVSQKLNLAALYMALHRPMMAREVLRELDSADMSVYGISSHALVSLMTARQLNDEAAAQRAWTVLQANRTAAPGQYRDALITDNRMDEAAQTVIAQLADPMERGQVLLELQDMREGPVLVGERDYHDRWNQMEKRADVQAAVAKVGRIATYPLFAY